MRALLLALVVIGMAAPAAAATLFSENFGAPGFVGYTVDPNDISDRFGATSYALINDFDGWTFDPSATFLSRPVGGTDGAVMLNENGSGGSARRTVTGLTAGKTYQLGFLLGGDNEPGQPYVLKVGIDGAPAATFTGVDGAPGSTLGTIQHLMFVARTSSVMLAFTQASQSTGSPTIDDVSVAVVPEPAIWGLMIAGFALVGVAARHRRATTARLACR